MINVKIMDRYIVKELLGPFGLAVCGCVIIGIVDILFTLIELFVNSGVPFLIVLRLLLYKIPAIMVLFFPMAMLFAVMLVLIRMAKDNEITVLRASGINILRILVPFVLVAIFVTSLSYMTNEKLVPWTNHVSNTLIRQAIMKKPPPDIAENVFFKETGDRFFYIKKVDSKTSTMKNLMIYEILPDYPRVITAKTAKWNKKTWTLLDGSIHKYDSDGIIKYHADFAEMKIHVNRDVHSFYTKQKTPKEMDSTELKKKIKTLDRGGIKTQSLKVELWMKKSMPAASLSFAIIGMSLCIFLVSSGKDWWGVIFSVLIALLSVGFYFFVMAVFRSFGRGGMIPPFIAAWAPNVLFSTIGIVLILYKTLKR